MRFQDIYAFKRWIIHTVNTARYLNLQYSERLDSQTANPINHPAVKR